MQVGDSSTIPARTDFKIGNSFAGQPPENGVINPTTVPIWNSGLGNFKFAGVITAGGAGTIREMIAIMSNPRSDGVETQIALFRDLITPNVGFIAGQTIAVEYTVQL